jgi:glycosyltransferase involved in cell wall biosynthesis
VDAAIVPVRAGIQAVPSKLYEAMASGVPVVVVAEGDVQQIVEGGGIGIALDPGDVDGIAAALTRLADSAGERERMGAAGRRTAIERYDRKAICDRFIDALEDA